MKKLYTLAAMGLAAGPAFANTEPPECVIFPELPQCSAAIPEISALEGTAALAVIAAVVLLAWERRLRAA